MVGTRAQAAVWAFLGELQSTAAVWAVWASCGLPRRLHAAGAQAVAADRVGLPCGPLQLRVALRHAPAQRPSSSRGVVAKDLVGRFCIFDILSIHATFHSVVCEKVRIFEKILEFRVDFHDEGFEMSFF